MKIHPIHLTPDEHPEHGFTITNWEYEPVERFSDGDYIDAFIRYECPLCRKKHSIHVNDELFEK